MKRLTLSEIRRNLFKPKKGEWISFERLSSTTVNVKFSSNRCYCDCISANLFSRFYTEAAPYKLGQPVVLMVSRKRLK